MNPAHSPSVSQTTLGDRTPAPPAGPRLLVVEDDDQVRRCVRLILSRLGYQVEEACDGRDAWAKLTGNGRTFELVITDDQLPFLSGLELVQKARAEALNMPFILMSGLLTEELTCTAWRGGVAGLVAKPFTWEQLVAAVESALSRLTH